MKFSFSTIHGRVNKGKSYKCTEHKRRVEAETTTFELTERKTAIGVGEKVTKRKTTIGVGELELKREFFISFSHSKPCIRLSSHTTSTKNWSHKLVFQNYLQKHFIYYL